MNEELRGRVLSYCADDPGLRARPLDSGVVGISVQQATGTCRVTFPEGRPARLMLQRELTLTREQQGALTGAGLETLEMFNRAVEGLAASRSSLVTGNVVQETSGWVARIAHPVYVDGLSQHALFAALSEVERFARLVSGWVDGLAPIAELQRQTAQVVGHAQQVINQPVGPSVCPRCGQAVAAGAGFCTGCGARTDAAGPGAAPAVVAPRVAGPTVDEAGATTFYRPEPRPGPNAQAQQPAPANPVCSKCGTASRPGTKFCVSCGNRI